MKASWLHRLDQMPLKFTSSSYIYLSSNLTSISMIVSFMSVPIKASSETQNSCLNYNRCSGNIYNWLDGEGYSLLDPSPSHCVFPFFFICTFLTDFILPYLVLEFFLHKSNLLHQLTSSLLVIGFPGGLDGKASARSAGDLGSIPGLERSPGEGNGNPLQCSCLENLLDGGAW